MLIITIIRIIIFAMFLLLLIEGIAAVILSLYFYRLYVRKHRILEVRMENVEHHLGLSKENEL